MSEPLSPRQRMLAEDNPVPTLPTAEEREQAAQAAAQARAEMEFPPELEMGNEPDEAPEPPEVLSAQEIESQLTRLDDLLNADIPEIQRQVEADDALQGITVILGMGFSGDVQTMVLAALQRYRTIKNY